MNDEQLLRYSRHVLLNEIGVEGQERIRSATMLVVGAGGLGSPAAYYLASAGVARILLVDGDRVDLTNLQRQILHTTDRVGTPKAESGRTTLAAINPDVEVVPIVRRVEGAAISVGRARRMRNSTKAAATSAPTRARSVAIDSSGPTKIHGISTMRSAHRASRTRSGSSAQSCWAVPELGTNAPKTSRL